MIAKMPEQELNGLLRTEFETSAAKITLLFCHKLAFFVFKKWHSLKTQLIIRLGNNS